MVVLLLYDIHQEKKRKIQYKTDDPNPVHQKKTKKNRHDDELGQMIQKQKQKKIKLE